MNRFRAVALATVLVLVIAACSRSDDGKAASSSSSATGGTSSSSTNDATALANGGFGDLSKVCSPGDAKGATDKGVTDTEIHVGTVTDKGFAGRQGLDKEMVDAAIAFSKWCNDHGGILGRKLVVDDLDAALTNYNGMVMRACDSDLALVAGGAVLDDSDNGAREACGLPNIPGYVVSAKARAAGLQVQPLPNPVYQVELGAYKAVNGISPGAFDHVGMMTVDFGSTKTVNDQSVEAIQQLGGTIVDQQTYDAGGEANWTPFVEELKNKGVRMLEVVGEPVNTALLQKAMQTDGFYPDVIMEATNHYDQSLINEAGSALKNTWIRSSFVPLEQASQNKATQDYLDVMKQYNPDGKVALLGVQATSSMLLFAKAAAACGSNLTRQCLVDQAKSITSWTGGGLHAETNPGGNQPTQCYLLMQATPEGFTYDQAHTKPNKGLFNCDPTNVLTLQNTYDGIPH